jgi:hypothetical protein
MKRDSSGSAERLSRDEILVLGAAAIFGAAAYLFASSITFRVGFPLDDSWIHQTYARNLALHGEWAFRLGQPSAGSTAPLWSGLLATGYWLRLAPHAWAYVLGTLTLWLLAVVGETSARRALPAYRPRLPWIGMFLAFEWHLLWAAMSGMETLLYALLVTAVLAGLMTNSRRYMYLGVLTGLSVWVRPDGLTLVAPAALTIVLVETDMRARLRALEQYLIGFGAFFCAYLLFNLWIGGRPMPNTFYAKQAEYAAWQARPALEKLGELGLQFLVGPAFILAPGAAGWLIRSVRRRDWGILGGGAWFLGYVWLYVSRLPLYQHGRYVMPAMPIFFLWGLLGIVEFSRLTLLGRYQWFAKTLWQTSLLLVTGLFVILGAHSYGEDVAVIESEMVASAKWAKQNLPPEATLAAHDIGALGYFDDHPLIDLAGLVSPEVAPFIRDEARLADFLDERKADYIIAFPDFYPQLLLGHEIVFETKGQFAPKFEEPNMTIYRWK